MIFHHSIKPLIVLVIITCFNDSPGYGECPIVSGYNLFIVNRSDGAENVVIDGTILQYDRYFKFVLIVTLGPLFEHPQDVSFFNYDVFDPHLILDVIQRYVWTMHYV